MENLYENKKTEKEYAEKYMENIYGFYGYGMWLVTLKDGTIIGRAGIEFYENIIPDEKEIIGTIYLNTDEIPANNDGVHLLGYVIGEKYQGHRYALEACANILLYAREILCINEVKVQIHRDNTASICLAKKLGFEFE